MGDYSESSSELLESFKNVRDDTGITIGEQQLLWDKGYVIVKVS